jgi:tRNA-uridine 2-sulfurtransferase
MSMKKIFVGLSGGVDSSLSAALLVEQGYDVTGVYMKNWSKPIGKFDCPWEEDYRDAKRVAVHLGMPFEMYDFETEYFDKVVGYMLDSFRAGITPNPDVMCNQEIKFKLFLETCMGNGADYIATGHYARTENGKLLRAVDDNKDQTYFLYRVTKSALDKTIFPLGEYTKPEVRTMAKQYNLPTAARKESMGICFVGKVGIKDFLKEYIGPGEKGSVINQHGATIGEHEGAIFYTIGQRQGMGIGGGLPYYVTGKDMVKNEVYVTSDISDPTLWSDKIVLTSNHLVDSSTILTDQPKLYVRTRHRAPLVGVSSVTDNEDGTQSILLDEPLRALTPGQSAVLYTDTECLGGGVISTVVGV